MVRAGSRSVTRAGPPPWSRAPHTTRAEHKDRSAAAGAGSLGTASVARARRAELPRGRPDAAAGHVGCVAASGTPSSMSPATAPSGPARTSLDTPRTGVPPGGCSCPAVADPRRGSELLVDPPRRGSTSPPSAHGGQLAPMDPVAAIGWIRSSPLLKRWRLQVVMCELYRPSRRRMAPIVPSGALSVCAKILSLYAAVNVRRAARSGVSGSGSRVCVAMSCMPSATRPSRGEAQFSGIRPSGRASSPCRAAR